MSKNDNIKNMEAQWESFIATVILFIASLRFLFAYSTLRLIVCFHQPVMLHSMSWLSTGQVAFLTYLANWSANSI